MILLWNNPFGRRPDCNCTLASLIQFCYLIIHLCCNLLMKHDERMSHVGVSLSEKEALESRCGTQQVNVVCQSLMSCFMLFDIVTNKNGLRQAQLSYLSRRDVGVADISMDMLNLRQLTLRHLNQLCPSQITVPSKRSVSPQRPYSHALRST